MSTPPDPASLYPDVASTGSLGAALRAAAAEQGLSFPVISMDSDLLRQAAVPSAIPHRKDLRVSAYHFERRWSVEGCESAQDMELIGGNTQDLAEVARAAQAWRDGADLTEIHRVAPFVELSGRFEVPDDDPAGLTESEWQHLRKEAAEVDWPEYHALIEAAYAEPTLRQLYPFTSHWTLRFSTRTRPSLSSDVAVCLDATRGKGYVVRAYFMGEPLGETATADEAVSLAMRHVPAELGPATSGATES